MHSEGGATSTSEEAGEATAPAPDPEEERERAREYLLRALTASAKSRSRLARGLADRDVDPDIAAEVLDRFEEVGLIDDVQYAHTLVRTRFAERGLSRRALAAELRNKGIAEAVARDALDQVDDDAELMAARRLAASRAARMTSLPPDVRRRRLAGFLGRKGYSASVSMQVIREVVDGAD